MTPEFRRCFFVDGSNVAVPNTGAQRPLHRRIELLQAALLDSFDIEPTDIVILVDHIHQAELTRQAPGKVKRMRRNGTLRFMARHVEADLVLLQHAREHHACVISNDRYRDHTPWRFNIPVLGFEITHSAVFWSSHLTVALPDRTCEIPLGRASTDGWLPALKSPPRKWPHNRPLVFD